MSIAEQLALALDPARILRAQKLLPDPWQEELLLSNRRQILLNCSRQAGKSRTVSARAQHAALCHPGRLKVLRSACPNLLAEARLYRYPTASPGQLPTENPRDEHNHALGALRYLISRIDAHAFHRFRKKQPDPAPEPAQPLDLRDERLWSTR
jgi:hypothetical protein